MFLTLLCFSAICVHPSEHTVENGIVADCRARLTKQDIQSLRSVVKC